MGAGVLLQKIHKKLASAWPAWALLVPASFAGNYFSLWFYSGVEIYFGSIAVLVAVRLFGPGWGVLAALGAGAATVVLWHHPYDLILYLCEALAVGLMCRRQSGNLVLSDGLFWLFAGMPLTWLLYYFGAASGETMAAFFMLQKAINGGVNALIASLVVYFASFSGWLKKGGMERPVSLRQTLFSLLVASAMVPALVITVLDGRAQWSLIEQSTRDRLQTVAANIARDWLALESAWQSGAPVSGEGFLRAQLALHAPGSRTSATVVDPSGRVIASSRPGLAPGFAFDPKAGGEIVRLDRAAYIWLPAERGQMPVMRWKRAYYVRETPLRAGRLGTVVVDTPVEPYLLEQVADLLNRMLLVMGLSVLAFVMGSFLSRRLTTPLRKLAEATTDLKRKMPDGGEVGLPWSPLAEMDALIRNFGDMAASLRQSYQNLYRANELLEQRVQERTRELMRANEELKTEIAERIKFEQALAEHTLELRSQKFALDQHSIVGITDRDGNIVYVNDKFCEIAQYSREELLGRNHRILNSGHPKSFFADLWETITQGKVWHGEIRNRKKNGDLYWVETTIVPFPDASGIPYQYVSIRTDITARKQYEAELLGAKEAAEQASRAKSRFLSRMSHELRTPLNAIIGFGQLMENDPLEPLSPSQKENVGHILKAGWHLLELINEVLDLSRIEAGRMRLNLEPVEVAPIISECFGLIEPLAQERGILLEDETGSCASLRAMADRMRLKQVLLNFLSNAVKYNREKGRIIVACEPTAQGGVRISVTDTGFGIPRGSLGQLFQPFSRLDADKTEIQGAGVGLAVAKYLVELMGGVIGVESTEGVGSTFWAELRGEGGSDPPQREEAALSAPEPAGEPSGPQGVRNPTEPAEQRVLLYVEHNPDSMSLVRQMVARRPDLRLLEAETAEKGLEIARVCRPDVILLDIHLPDVNGFEVLQRLRWFESTRRIPVIAFSANAPEAEVRHGLEAGFFAYLTKPVDVERFLQTVDAALNSRSGGVRTEVVGRGLSPQS
jgi:PAS domain S-box-containing protein